MPAQDLVPRNQPYGARQELVAQASQAGLPLSSDQGPAPRASQPQPAAGRAPDPSYDALAGEPTRPLTPIQQPPDRVAEFVAAASLSGNEFAAAVAANLPRYLR